MSQEPSPPIHKTPDADPATQAAMQAPPVSAQSTPGKNYFELRLRIRYWWLWTALGLTIVVYPIAILFTALSRQSYEASGARAQYQKQWEDTGCVDILKAQANTNQMEDWEVKRNWQHQFRLDSSYLAWNDQAILNEPFCLGARIRKLDQNLGPWRYDIVDSKTKTILISITPKK